MGTGHLYIPFLLVRWCIPGYLPGYTTVPGLYHGADCRPGSVLPITEAGLMQCDGALGSNRQ